MPLLVLIDMFAVSLVVPLLFRYYIQAGVTSAHQREFLSSLFSVSQIVGGLLFGVLTDAKLLQRKTILLLSFGGSAVSYAMIVFGGLYAILFSRVLVGLVKQTMTVATTLLTQQTTSETRAKNLGRLKAASSVAWIVGPSAGALLYKHVDETAPALFACALFVLNFLLALVFLEGDGHHQGSADAEDNEKVMMGNEKITDTDCADDSEENGIASSFTAENGLSEKRRQQQQGTKLEKQTSQLSGKRRQGFAIMLSNIRSCFSSQALGAVIVTKLLITWVARSTSYAQLGSYYESMYGLEPHNRGYISSWQQVLKLIVNLSLVAPVLSWTGGEHQAVVYGTAVMAVATWFESQQSLWLFLVVLCPLISLSVTITDVSVQSLVTHVAPTASLFSVLAALDVLENAVSVSVPFYRTFLFRLLTADTSKYHAMEGDPDPVSWVRSSGMHYAAAALVAAYLFRETRRRSWTTSDGGGDDVVELVSDEDNRESSSDTLVHPKTKKGR